MTAVSTKLADLTIDLTLSNLTSHFDTSLAVLQNIKKCIDFHRQFFIRLYCWCCALDYIASIVK